MADEGEKRVAKASGDASSSESEAKDQFPVDDDVTLRKVLFDVDLDQDRDVMSPGQSSPSRRRRSRVSSIGGRGTYNVPIRAGLTETQVQGLREAFGLFDPEGSGRICPKAVRQAAASAGLEEDSPEVWRLLAGLESESHDSVDFEDFIALLTDPLGDHYTRKGTAQLLNLFGPSAVNADCVSLLDLRRLADELGIEMQDDELRSMLDKAGADDGGQLSLEAFYEVMRHQEVSETS
mmetsp:Transcript_19374/g.43871  ORF Transcript_19374/g.43871 Transcript_19374/m.43871 type:complete len:236 (-) Transcript_19374:17-724(-)